MDDQLKLKATGKKISGEIILPGSKSISNRLLVMAYLNGTEPNFHNLSEADDTIRIQQALEEIEQCAASRIPMIVDAADAGTVVRFLAACLAIKTGKWLITGSHRMKQRPVGGLVDALNTLGADVQYAAEIKFPPLRITGKNLAGGSVDVDASQSSQFVTALMLVASYLEKGLTINLVKKPVSFAYIKMTESLMKQCGAAVEVNSTQIVVKPGQYACSEMIVEADWSSASYWYEIAALGGDADVFLPGLTETSVQGDSVCADLFQTLGVNTSFEKEGIRLKSASTEAQEFTFDFTDYPDLVPALMATCVARQIKGTFYGIGHLKFKESDRVKSLSLELAKTGATIHHAGDTITLTPPKQIDKNKPIVFDTHADHRIAMCLAPLVLLYDEVIVNNPEVVSKSYPGFWNDLRKIGLADVEKIKPEL